MFLNRKTFLRQDRRHDYHNETCSILSKRLIVVAAVFLCNASSRENVFHVLKFRLKTNTFTDGKTITQFYFVLPSHRLTSFGHLNWRRFFRQYRCFSRYDQFVSHKIARVKYCRRPLLVSR